MKVGIVLNSNDDAEEVWNTFRFGLALLNNNHRARIFLLGKGVDYDEIADEQYNVREQAELFVAHGGEILACGTCLVSRQKEVSNICTINSMQDLVELVTESDRVLTFG